MKLTHLLLFLIFSCTGSKSKQKNNESFRSELGNENIVLLEELENSYTEYLNTNYPEIIGCKKVLSHLNDLVKNKTSLNQFPNTEHVKLILKFRKSNLFAKTKNLFYKDVKELGNESKIVELVYQDNEKSYNRYGSEELTSIEINGLNSIYYKDSLVYITDDLFFETDIGIESPKKNMNQIIDEYRLKGYWKTFNFGKFRESLKMIRIEEDGFIKQTISDYIDGYEYTGKEIRIENLSKYLLENSKKDCNVINNYFIQKILVLTLFNNYKDKVIG